MTGNPEWLYASVLPLTPERLERTTASRRYSDAVLRELPIKRSALDDHVLMTVSQGAGSREYLVLEQYMPDADWTVKVLMGHGLGLFSGAHDDRWSLVLLFLCLFAGLIGLACRDPAPREAATSASQMEVAAPRPNSNISVEERTCRPRPRQPSELRQTQADLIQAGKLAGLGQMSAALST